MIGKFPLHVYDLDKEILDPASPAEGICPSLPSPSMRML
jgi:hypothetical protein